LTKRERLTVRASFFWRQDQRLQGRKKFFATVYFLLDVRSIEFGEFDVVSLLSISEKLVVERAVFFFQASRFHNVSVERGSNTVVFSELTTLLKEQSADGVKQRIVGAIDSKGIISSL
jgi:hypothetical protein